MNLSQNSSCDFIVNTRSTLQSVHFKEKLVLNTTYRQSTSSSFHIESVTLLHKRNNTPFMNLMNVVNMKVDRTSRPTVEGLHMPKQISKYFVWKCSVTISFNGSSFWPLQMQIAAQSTVFNRDNIRFSSPIAADNIHAGPTFGTDHTFGEQKSSAESLRSPRVNVRFEYSGQSVPETDGFLNKPMNVGRSPTNVWW